MSRTGSGLVKTRATVSEKVISRATEEPKQMDTAGNRGFSGTRGRQGQEASSWNSGLPSTPRTRWVTGAGLKYPAEEKRKPRRATKDAAANRRERRLNINGERRRLTRATWNEETLFSHPGGAVNPNGRSGPRKKKAMNKLRDKFSLLTSNSNG